MRIAFFAAYLASKLPCHPSYVTWSREHVIPKSILPRNITSDPRNILPLPKHLNNARSNLPYTNEWKDGYLVRCSNCPNPGFCSGSMIINPSGANPPDAWKGPIARSVLYSVARYPHISDTVNDKVLNLKIALEWDKKFPLSNAEIRYQTPDPKSPPSYVSSPPGKPSPSEE